MSHPAPKKKNIAKAPLAKKSPVALAPADFVAAFYAHLLPSDLALFSATDRARIATSIWTLGASRSPGEARLRVFNPSPESDGWTVDHTVVEIVNDDMPFLVDSVTGVLQNRGLTVHLVIHPIVSIIREAAGKAGGSALGVAKAGAKDAGLEILHPYSNRPLFGRRAIEGGRRRNARDA